MAVLEAKCCELEEALYFKHQPCGTLTGMILDYLERVIKCRPLTGPEKAEYQGLLEIWSAEGGPFVCLEHEFTAGKFFTGRRYGLRSFEGNPPLTARTNYYTTYSYQNMATPAEKLVELEEALQRRHQEEGVLADLALNYIAKYLKARQMQIAEKTQYLAVLKKESQRQGSPFICLNDHAPVQNRRYALRSLIPERRQLLAIDSAHSAASESSPRPPLTSGGRPGKPTARKRQCDPSQDSDWLD